MTGILYNVVDEMLGPFNCFSYDFKTKQGLGYLTSWQFSYQKLC